MRIISNLAMPIVLALVGMIMMLSKKDMMSEFVTGAREGMKTCVNLLPTMVLLICAVSMFNSSGAADYLAALIAPLLSWLGIPGEISGIVIVRPISGGAATAMIEAIYEKYGTDSFAGRCTSVIAGSSDTIIYIIALYFGSVGVKKTRYALPAAILTMMFCVVFSCFLCRIFF